MMTRLRPPAPGLPGLADTAALIRPRTAAESSEEAFSSSILLTRLPAPRSRPAGSGNAAPRRKNRLTLRRYSAMAGIASVPQDTAQTMGYCRVKGLQQELYLLDAVE